MRLALVALCLTACSVGDRYVIAPETLASVQALDPPAREHTAAPVRRIKNDVPADVRASTLSIAEAQPRPDALVAIPTRMHSHRIAVAHALVWTGTPVSIAGLCMVIFGRNSVRWSGIALAAAAEPVMITGTVLWVKAANAHPQELPRGLADVTYLPTPGVLAR